MDVDGAGDGVAAVVVVAAVAPVEPPHRAASLVQLDRTKVPGLLADTSIDNSVLICFDLLTYST